MNKHIRLLIEKFSDLFTDGLLNTNDVYADLSNEIFYKYYPKTKEELKTLIEQLLKERGEDAFLNDIDLSKITDMSELFKDLDPHNIDIRYWDVSNVKNMNNMFKYCYHFNCDLSNWDVSNVEDMCFMFDNCKKLTGKGLENWKPIKCKKIKNMFDGCTNFDCDLSGWDVSNVENMSSMFYNCSKFRGEGLDSWKPIKCKKIKNMFDGCTNFDCDLSGWDVSNVENMKYMFADCTKFRGKGLEEWKSKHYLHLKSKNMVGMFNYCDVLKSYPSWYNKIK